jgi:hypothetical protein
MAERSSDWFSQAKRDFQAARRQEQVQFLRIKQTSPQDIFLFGSLFYRESALPDFKKNIHKETSLFRALFGIII